MLPGSHWYLLLLPRGLKDFPRLVSLLSLSGGGVFQDHRNKDFLVAALLWQDLSCFSGTGSASQVRYLLWDSLCQWLSPALLFLHREVSVRPTKQVNASPGHLLIVGSQSIPLACGTEF